MALRSVVAVGLLAFALAGCGKQTEQSAKPQLPAAAQKAPIAPLPDVGKLETVTVTAQGSGRTASEAVSEAMRLAILQVNGAAIDESTMAVKFGLDITDGQDSLSVRGSTFAEAVGRRSKGAISNFKILSLEEPGHSRNNYKVSIEAAIAKFQAPADLKKVKIAIGPIRTNAASFVVGSQTIPATRVVEEIRTRVTDALTNTGRFAVLDRDVSADVQHELDLVATGQAPASEMAKLSQAVTADVIWAAKLDSLAYNRYARPLRTSERELVSYSGGWALSQRLINVSTRQLLAANSLQGQVPSIGPTTMPVAVDSLQILQGIETAMADAIVQGILSRTFPLTVVTRDGNNVTLSQGGQSVRVGVHYAVVALGQEIKDPQTGQSLGFSESPCCELVVERVAQNLSYGHLEKVNVQLDQLPPAALQVREPLMAMAAAAPAAPRRPADAAAREPLPKPLSGPVAVPQRARTAAPDERAVPSRKSDDTKW